MTAFAHPYLHLVITDVLMPELDGRALGVRLSERWPDLPVLYISGFPADDLFHRGAPATGAPFLQKPFQAEELLAMVERLLAPVQGNAFHPGSSSTVPLDRGLTPPGEPVVPLQRRSP
jgi:FixJ family two-component response regulator